MRHYVITLHELWRYDEGWSSNRPHHTIALVNVPETASERAIIRRCFRAMRVNGCGMKRTGWAGDWSWQRSVTGLTIAHNDWCEPEQSAGCLGHIVDWSEA